ncbi:hypothetical protein F4553_006924 [Allocatelliglobosispora scoriae]|uniref:DUF1707 domain-containing protein n=1 Tax=Allocatelliglobosispora scoriae TaxID=643052 RepID=A0A841C3G0_9ACTN|nr:DUF1707 domain-containing protein [Allocatelliglobosispora scoriae]MBB5873490.1 hypothetical protein [Allocatelliglobosispora scoriae]
MRASDADRRAVIARLGTALSEGRLDQAEHDRRVARVPQSVTYGDLAQLYADLPTTSLGIETRSHVTYARVDGVRRPKRVGYLPTWVRVLWTIWLTIVSINIALWAMVSVTNRTFTYFWPIWVAIPTAAGLLSISLGTALVRHERQAKELRRNLKVARRSTLRRT